MPTTPITAKTKLVGVLGSPVEHSLSPLIHNAALQAAGLDMVYVAFDVGPDQFETVVRGLAAAGAVGVNCTVPHKTAAYDICDLRSDAAEGVGAVNTLHFRENGIHGTNAIYGTNTDVEGYVESLRHDGGFDWAGKSVVQFGAGGAGRGMAFGALEAGAKRLTIVNRTVAKAESLATELAALHPGRTVAALSPGSPDGVGDVLAAADLVANGTSLGLSEGDPFPCDAARIPRGALVFDAAYTASRSTAWLRAAADRGCPTLDGLGMLVRQGAAAFRLWTGSDPDLQAMFGALP